MERGHHRADDQQPVLLYSIFLSQFGISIIAFTLIVRAIMIPLSVKQSLQLRAMSALQPKLKEIQERYSKDRQRISQETMKLYKQEGVNPLGCLGPMFIQFPIWIGLYQALLQTLPSTPESLVGLSGHLYSWLPIVPPRNSSRQLFPVARSGKTGLHACFARPGGRLHVPHAEDDHHADAGPQAGVGQTA